jgi:hypothetical protein
MPCQLSSLDTGSTLARYFNPLLPKSGMHMAKFEFSLLAPRDLWYIFNQLFILLTLRVV